MNQQGAPMLNRIHALLSSRFVFRDAGSGRYVTKAYALLHPLTTVREKVALQDEGDLHA
jgi:hypothetical protein